MPYAKGPNDSWVWVEEGQAGIQTSEAASQNNDFTGDAGSQLGQIEGSAGEMTAEQIAEMRRKKEAWMASQGLDMNGNQLPAYGTPQSQGGTAQGWATMPNHSGSHVIYTSPLGSNDQLQPGAAITQNVVNTAAGQTNSVKDVGVVSPGDTGLASGAGFVDPNPPPLVGGGGAGGGSGRGAALTGQTNQGTMDLRDKIQTDGSLAADGIALAAANAGDMNPLTNRGLTSTAAEQARTALGPAPTIDQNLADRNSGRVSQAVQQAGKVVDQALAPVGQKNVNSAMSAARNVLDQALNGPDTTARIGAQTLRNQLALARSASGGAGGVQEAMRNAQFAAPELLAQASDAGIREQQAKLGIASQQTGQLAQTALGQQQNTTQRLGVAAQAAGTSAQAAQGQRGQDIEIAKANLDAGTNLANQISQLTGQQLQLNQQNQELLGNMAKDLAKTQFDYSQLDAQTQDAEFERWIKAYGIDVAAAAQIRAAAQANEKGVMDYLMPIIGGLGAAVL